MQHDIRHIEPDEDPVCGMRVDIDEARSRDLKIFYEGREYVFCGKGCMLDFRDDPVPYLKAGHLPMM